MSALDGEILEADQIPRWWWAVSIRFTGQSGGLAPILANRDLSYLGEARKTLERSEKSGIVTPLTQPINQIYPEHVPSISTSVNAIDTKERNIRGTRRVAVTTLSFPHNERSLCRAAPVTL